MADVIKCSEATQKRLRKHGKMGDSYEDVIKRFLDESKRKK